MKLAGLVIGGFGLPQRLQVAIDAHQGHSEHLAELGLRQRQRAGIAFHQPGKFGAMELLAEEMRDPCRAVTAAVVGDAFAEDCRIDQGFAPNRESDGRSLRKCLHQLIVGNRADDGTSQRHRPNGPYAEETATVHPANRPDSAAPNTAGHRPARCDTCAMTPSTTIAAAVGRSPWRMNSSPLVSSRISQRRRRSAAMSAASTGEWYFSFRKRMSIGAMLSPPGLTPEQRAKFRFRFCVK